MSATQNIRLTAPEYARLQGELEYLRRNALQTAAKIMVLDIQAVTMRAELEQKRRGFSLMAELATTLGRNTDYQTVFTSVCRRINATLNMQRTAVLLPNNGAGTFSPSVLQGYTDAQEARIISNTITLPKDVLNPKRPVVVTGADAPERHAKLRQMLELPFFISSPVFLNDEIAAVLVTGRIIEQLPWMPRLGRNDAETVKTVSAYLAAMLAGQRIAEAEQRNSVMLNALPICCNFWSPQLHNIDCNEAAARLFDLPDKATYLSRFSELSPVYQPNGRLSSEAISELVRSAFERGHAHFEWMHQKLNGEPIPTEVKLVRVRWKNAHIVASYTRDLREQKAMLAAMHKTQDALRLARDLAEQSAKAKSEFLANMSHEIRTPMNAVLGMIHLLADTPLSDKQKIYLEKADHSAELLLNIINDILDFSKIDAGRLKIEKTVFSIPQVLRTVCDVIKEPAAQKALTITMDVQPDVPDWIIGDPLRLEQIILNITNNAIKFTSAGDISIRISKVMQKTPEEALAEYLQFEIADTGIGMTREQISTLFTPFTQADTSTTRKFGGTGLGLAISRSLVEMMGGWITCASRPNEGSTFTFTILLQAAEPPEEALLEAPPQTADAHAASNGKNDAETTDDFTDIAGMHILLAEDNEINQLVAQELLAAKGVTIDIAPNGREALKALEHGHYDLVLMDIQMPEMDGLAAVRHIRQNKKYRTLPIIAMTAHAMVGDREISLSNGMNDHITKPINADILYATLRRWKR